LEDITIRALRILQNVDFIICEDSRISSKLLNSYKILEKKFIIYNDHDGEEKRKKILHQLVSNKSLALISDAGTPLVSDPGFKLVRFLQKFNQKIIPVPGASAILAAISASGIASDSFAFVGFLPSSEIQRKNFLEDLPKDQTLIFFEAANRIQKVLRAFVKIFPSQKIALAKELTKIHEEFIIGDAKFLLNFFDENPSKLKGEFVILLEKANEQEMLSEDGLKEFILKEINLGNSLKDLSQNLSKIFNINKRKIYQIALEIKESLK
jgi:16S rRNA (cytidine1402-2'-O)-methyltransferase